MGHLMSQNRSDLGRREAFEERVEKEHASWPQGGQSKRICDDTSIRSRSPEHWARGRGAIEYALKQIVQIATLESRSAKRG
jgi:hypothetical protein